MAKNASLLSVGYARLIKRCQHYAQRNITGALTWQAKRLGQRRAEQRITKRHQDERERVVMQQAIFMPINRKIIDKIVDRLNNRIERILIARKDHPARKCARALPIKRIEGEINNVARAAFAAPRLDHCGGNINANRLGQ